MVGMDLSYPIGKFNLPESVTPEMRPQLIGEIEAASAQFRAAVQGLTDQQLDTPYRPGGWTVRQVVHHVADSHLNAYVRFRLPTDSPPLTLRVTPAFPAACSRGYPSQCFE